MCGKLIGGDKSAQFVRCHDVSECPGRQRVRIGVQWRENERLSARTQVKQRVREGQRVGEPKRRVNMRQYLVWRTHSIGKCTFFLRW